MRTRTRMVSAPRLADKSRVKTSRRNASTAQSAKAAADNIPSTSRSGEASSEEKQRPPSSSFNPSIPSPAKKLSLSARAHDPSSTVVPARSSDANGAPSASASRTAQEGEMVKFYTSDGKAVTGVVVGGVLQPLMRDARDAEMGGRISNATGAHASKSARGDALRNGEDDVRAPLQDVRAPLQDVRAPLQDVRAPLQDESTMADQSDSLALPDEDKLMRQYVAQHERAQRKLGAQTLPSSSNSNAPASSGSVSDDGSSANTKTRQESSGPPIAGGRGRWKESQSASQSRPAPSSSSSCAPSSSRADLAGASANKTNAAATTSSSKGARLSMQLANGTTKDVSTLTRDDVHALHPDVLEQLRKLLGDASVAG
ncbi:hypothetical protein CBOM_00507 [Ceraceosorus bombacis]|uniref:Uncharacterized protein n=1 Tax=Ceraceosorus bombacis TaxID=401625 RepID=A0A0P1B972_9BASI|nr:hypothetical protein CBOM_00507 [Ceraceosorus bombacis]